MQSSCSAHRYAAASESVRPMTARCFSSTPHGPDDADGAPWIGAATDRRSAEPDDRFAEPRTNDMTERPVGKTKDAGWQIGFSRTIQADIGDVWHYLVSPEGLAVWLGPGTETSLEVGSEYRTKDGTSGEIRSLRHFDRIRLTWQPPDRPSDATVQVAVTPTRTGCTLRFHTERLYDADERERMRAHWKVVADRIEAALTASG